MSASLDCLPFDILFQISSILSLDEVVRLCQTCRQLRMLLEEDTVCRRTVRSQHHYTDEARAAANGVVTYRQALQAIYDRRHALTAAYPFSARTLGRGNTFLYRDGVLCVLGADAIRISRVDVRSSSLTLNLGALVLPYLDPNVLSHGVRASLMYYRDGILAVHINVHSNINGGILLAVRITECLSDIGRVVCAIQLESSSKLFVRHTAHYLFYGTRTGIGRDGDYEWTISSVSLDPKYPLDEDRRPVVLHNFHGTDIASTVAFDIHDGYFYALSNQTTYEVEEIDWTAFYHVVRFPLDRPVQSKVQKNERIYRRQHAQGPIHDSWTDLSLQVDEATNEVIIVETRREWAQASSRQSRTFYTTKIHFEDHSVCEPSSPSIIPAQTLQLPDNDAFTALIDSSNNPHWMPTPNQYSRSQHPEFSPQEVSPRSFILARTKFRAYSYSASAFLDLVEDEHCCSDRQSCLRLRIGSRQPTSTDPLGFAGKGKAPLISEMPVFIDSTTYRHSPIRMWPPPAPRCPCSKLLHDIMNPQLGPDETAGMRSRCVTGVLDERRLVFLVKLGRSYGRGEDDEAGTLVCVDFGREGKGEGVETGLCRQRADSEKGYGNEDGLKWAWSPGWEKRCCAGTCA